VADRRFSFAAWAVAAATAACGSGTTNPSTPGPTIVCPASQTLQSPDGRPVTPIFAPVSVSGKTPLQVACTPAAGSAFPVGTNKVTCTATDADARQASCSFTVTVQGQPKLSVTKFTAFGDSITEGVTNPACGTITSFGLATPLQLAHESELLKANVDYATSYPTQLRTLVQGRYTTQSLAVTNDGSAGEFVSDPNTIVRLRTALDAEKPDVLLLQEGVNDLNGLHSAGIPMIRDQLQAMVQTARSRNIQVLLGTLLPQRVGACRGYAPSDIVPMNDAIRTMATANGATLVDLYQAFAGVPDPYIGQDGLHPNASGYQQMANTFFQMIQSKYEVK
jgi:lysophospholipase L1-like esterase